MGREHSQASSLAPARWYLQLRRMTWGGRRIDWSAYLFVLPFFCGFSVLVVGAIAFGTYVSFTEWGILGDPTWAGLANFQRALQDPWVIKIWSNTLRYG